MIGCWKKGKLLQQHDVEARVFAFSGVEAECKRLRLREGGQRELIFILQHDTLNIMSSTQDLQYSQCNNGLLSVEEVWDCSSAPTTHSASQQVSTCDYTQQSCSQLPSLKNKSTIIEVINTWRLDCLVWLECWVTSRWWAGISLLGNHCLSHIQCSYLWNNGDLMTLGSLAAPGPKTNNDISQPLDWH